MQESNELEMDAKMLLKRHRPLLSSVHLKAVSVKVNPEIKLEQI